MYLKSLSAKFDGEAIDLENRTVKGFFTDDSVDDHGHMIDPVAMKAAIKEYREWGAIRDMHGNPVGVAVSVGEGAWNRVVAKIVDDRVWNLIINGVYKGFSIGALVTGGKMVSISEIAEEKFSRVSGAIRGAIKRAGEVFVITELTLVEISVVDRPANPRAVFAKSADGGEFMALPSVTKKAGIDAIKSMLLDGSDVDGISALGVGLGEKSALPAENYIVEEPMEGMEEKDLDSVIEVIESDAGKDVAQGDPIAVAEESADETVEVEVIEKDLDVALDEPADEPAAVVVYDSEKVLSAISELAKSVESLRDELSAIKELVSAEPDQGEVETKVFVGDSQIEELARLVSEKIVVKRKSLIHDSSADDVETKVDIKSLGSSDLSAYIVNSVVKRATGIKV